MVFVAQPHVVLVVGRRLAGTVCEAVAIGPRWCAGRAQCGVAKRSKEKITRGERGGRNRPSKASYNTYTNYGIWIKREPMEGHIPPDKRTQRVPKQVVDKIEGCQY